MQSKYIIALVFLVAVVYVYSQNIWADPIGPLVEEQCPSLNQDAADKANLALQPPAPVWIGCGRQKPLDVIPFPPVNEEIVAGSKKLQSFGGVMIDPDKDTKIDNVSVKIYGDFEGKAKIGLFHKGNRISEMAEARSGETVALKISLCLFERIKEEVYVNGIADDIKPSSGIIKTSFSSIEGRSATGSIFLTSEFLK